MQPADPAFERRNIAIVSFGDRKVSHWNLFSFPVLKDYAGAHGYDCYLYTETLDSGRPSAWSKILYVLKHLKDHEWVMWVDSDCLLEQVHQRIECWIRDDKDLIFCRGGDSNALNSGVILVQNTPWAHAFLQAVYDQEFLVNSPRLLLPLSPDDYERRQACGCEGCLKFKYDQKAFLHVLHTMDPAEVGAHVELRSTQDKTSCFQSYDDAYWPGCFIQHFPGNQENKNYLRFIEHSRIALQRIRLHSGGGEGLLPAYGEPVQKRRLLKTIRSNPFPSQLMVFRALLFSALIRFLKPRDRLGNLLSMSQLERVLFKKKELL